MMFAKRLSVHGSIYTIFLASHLWFQIAFPREAWASLPHSNDPPNMVQNLGHSLESMKSAYLLSLAF